MKTLTRFLALLLLFAGSGLAQSSTIVVPELAEGNTNNVAPFGLGSPYFAPSITGRYQQIYGAEAFRRPGTITDLAFRLDEIVASYAGNSTLTDVLITLAVTSKPVDGLDSGFANNLTQPASVVYSGPLRFSWTAHSGPQRPFDLHIPLQTPFLYNPILGNLLLDVTIKVGNTAGSTIPTLDAAQASDSVSRVFVESSSPNGWQATSGSTNTIGLVTQFTMAPGIGFTESTPKWTSNGPDGGAIQAVAIDPQNPSTVYAAAFDRLFKTTNGGMNWQTTGLIQRVSSLAVDPQNPSTVYAGNSSETFKSVDGGQNWVTLSVSADALVIDPQHPGTIYAGNSRGVFKSTNAGATWSAAGGGLATDDAGVTTLAMDTQNPNTVFAGTENGLFKTTDGGKNWVRLNLTGLNYTLAVDPQQPDTIYAGSSAGMFKSTNGGASWSSMNSGLPLFLPVGALAIDPVNSSTIYASLRSTVYVSGGGLFESTDGGATWTDMRSALPNGISALAIDPKDPSTIYAATDGEEGFFGFGSAPLSVNPGSLGVFKSTDGAINWLPVSTGILKSTVYSLAVDAKKPGTIYAAANGSVFKSSDLGVRWSPANAGFPNDGILVTRLVSDPQRSDTVYAIASYPRARGYIGGVFKSTDGGNHWTLAKTFFNYLFGLAIDPQNTNTIYVGDAGGIFKSTDGGTTWATFFRYPGDDATPQPVLQVLAVDPQNAGTVYIGGALGVLRIDDGGAKWTKLNPGPFVIGILAIDPQNPNTLYAGGYGRDAFKSTDRGQNWVNLGIAAYTLAIDAQHSSTIYAGTETGAFKSTDGGANWLNYGLKERVLSLELDQQNTNTIYAGTYNSGVFAAALTQQLNFSMTARGGASLQTSGTRPSTVEGYAAIQPNTGSTTPAGLAILGFRQNNVLVTEASVPASPLIRSGRIYAEINEQVNTGLAMANPGNQPAMVSFFFTDSSGNSRNGGTTIPPNGQIAKFLDQAPFSGPSSWTGTFTFSSSVPIAVIALRGRNNERGEFLITTLPVADLTAPAATGTTLFPHFANGGGWTTQIILVNPGDSVLTGTIQFLDTAGRAATVDVNNQSNTSFAYLIPARSSQKFQTGGAAVVSGSVRVVPAINTSAPSGLAIFSLRNGANTVTETGVAAVEAGVAFRLYAEARGSIQTGIAVVNTSANVAAVTLELSYLDGSSTGLTGRLSIPPNGQTAVFLNEIDGFGSLPASFQGVLRVSSSAAIAVMGLRGRYNERDDFLITTTPAVNEARPPTTSVMYFPHIADSGGYTTQIILFNTQPGSTESGTIRLFNRSGGALDVPLQ